VKSKYLFFVIINVNIINVINNKFGSIQIVIIELRMRSNSAPIKRKFSFDLFDQVKFDFINFEERRKKNRIEKLRTQISNVYIREREKVFCFVKPN